MHKQGLIHRDIKPENILIKDGNIIKICDFGWCVQSDGMQQRNTFCGTLEYMAPEMIQNKNHNHTLDIWSLGILLYELVHGRAPFTGVHPREISDKIMRGQIRFKPGLSNEYKDLVNKILVYETSERLPLIKVFDHPWVKNFEKKYNLSKQPTKKEKKKHKDKDKAPEDKKDPEKQIKLANDIQVKKASTDVVLTGLLSDESKPVKKREEQEEDQQDIIKELEDYVNDKKKTGKYLDDISDFEAVPKIKERMSRRKDKPKEEPEKQNIDVYDYCDKMMKDLSHLDKQLENRMSTNRDNTSQRFSN